MTSARLRVDSAGLGVCVIRVGDHLIEFGVDGLISRNIDSRGDDCAGLTRVRGVVDRSHLPRVVLVVVIVLSLTPRVGLGIIGRRWGSHRRGAGSEILHLLIIAWVAMVTGSMTPLPIGLVLVRVLLTEWCRRPPVRR